MDPHEAGQIYPADLAEVAARWGLDAAKLRKKLNLASLPHHHIEIMSKRALRDSLKEFADTASKFASIIEQSEDQVIYRIWAGVPEINPGVLPHFIDAIRRNTSTEVRRLASLATHQYEMLSGAMEEKPPRGRVSDAVTVQERMVVGSLAGLWLES